MKIVPKYQRGSSFDSFFTTYTPSEYPTSKTSKSSKSSKSKSKDDDNELTEKDFLNMLKDIDGLPNDMQVIANNLVNTFKASSLGIDSGDLAVEYIQNLYQIKVANQNYEEYKNALKTAQTNGSLAEPAISTDGRLISQDSDGKLQYVTLDQYNNNPENYTLLSVSQLANLRKYDPALAYNQGVLDIINNSVGYEEFQKLINSAKTSLGNTKYSETSPATARMLEGLSQLENLSDEERVTLLQSINNGSIKYSTESNFVQIDSLLNYITSGFPERMKVWASLKTGNPNKEYALKKLVGDYLLGSFSTSRTVQGTAKMDTTRSKSSSSDSNLATNPNMTFWEQVNSGFGEDSSYVILSKDVMASANGKYYGTTPGLDDYKSLSKYITDSGVGYMIKNRDNITFGDNKLVNQDEVVVDPNAGAYVVTLPIDANGRVNFSILKEFNEITDNIIAQGYQKDTEEYNIALAQALKENNMDYLVEGSTTNSHMFARFLVLQGIGSSQTRVKSRNEQTTLKKVDSDFIIDSSEEKELFDLLENKLSTEYKELDLDNNWVRFNNDKIYRGNIFIPLSNNPNAAANAGNNSIRRGKAYEWEDDYQKEQMRNKLGGLNSTSSRDL